MLSSITQGLLAEIGFGEFLWSLLIIFFMITFFMILFNVVLDVFRSQDLSGGSKALWLIVVVIFPFVGLFIYLVVRGNQMHARQAQAMADSQAAVDDYVRQVAGGGSATEIAKAKELLDAGSINQAEFDAIKQKALS